MRAMTPEERSLAESVMLILGLHPDTVVEVNFVSSDDGSVQLRLALRDKEMSFSFPWPLIAAILATCFKTEEKTEVETFRADYEWTPEEN